MIPLEHEILSNYKNDHVFKVEPYMPLKHKSSPVEVFKHLCIDKTSLFLFLKMVKDTDV